MLPSKEQLLFCHLTAAYAIIEYVFENLSETSFISDPNIYDHFIELKKYGQFSILRMKGVLKDESKISND